MSQSLWEGINREIQPGACTESSSLHADLAINSSLANDRPTDPEELSTPNIIDQRVVYRECGLPHNTDMNLSAFEVQRSTRPYAMHVMTCEGFHANLQAQQANQTLNKAEQPPSVSGSYARS